MLVKGAGRKPYLLKKSSSSPPQPMNWFENPLTFLYSFGLIWKHPPIRSGYKMLKIENAFIMMKSSKKNISRVTGPLRGEFTGDAELWYFLWSATEETVWIYKYINYNWWEEISYQSPNFNGATVEVWEWISGFTPHFIKYVITFPCRESS